MAQSGSCACEPRSRCRGLVSVRNAVLAPRSERQLESRSRVSFYERKTIGAPCARAEARAQSNFLSLVARWIRSPVCDRSDRTPSRFARCELGGEARRSKSRNQAIEMIDFRSSSGEPDCLIRAFHRGSAPEAQYPSPFLRRWIEESPSRSISPAVAVPKMTTWSPSSCSPVILQSSQARQPARTGEPEGASSGTSRDRRAPPSRQQRRRPPR